jgi:hypothetical protein
MVCKYKNSCIDYDKKCVICQENGNWSYDKKANCYNEIEEELGKRKEGIIAR